MEDSKSNIFYQNETANEIGGEIDKSVVSLRFFDDNLSAEDITRLLKYSPSMSYRKGDFLRDEVTETGAWLLKGKKSSKSIETQITELFSLLSQDLQIWQELTTKYRADLFCGLWINGWNRGIALTSEILKQISDRGLKIDFDIYCEDEK